MGLIKEFLQFIKEEKKWWLLPLIFILIILGAFFAVTASPLAPFLYPLI